MSIWRAGCGAWFIDSRQCYYHHLRFQQPCKACPGWSGSQVVIGLCIIRLMGFPPLPYPLWESILNSLGQCHGLRPWEVIGSNAFYEMSSSFHSSVFLFLSSQLCLLLWFPVPAIVFCIVLLLGALYSLNLTFAASLNQLSSWLIVTLYVLFWVYTDVFRFLFIIYSFVYF